MISSFISATFTASTSKGSPPTGLMRPGSTPAASSSSLMWRSSRLISSHLRTSSTKVRVCDGCGALSCRGEGTGR